MLTSPTPFSPPASVVAQIAALPSMTSEDINALWRELYQTEPPVRRRVFKERRLAYRLQELAFTKQAPGQAKHHQQQLTAFLRPVRKTTDRPELEPGTVLTRDYRGDTHRVTVCHDGALEYQGVKYSSLSKIAREITGTRRSGPLFFGLTPRHKKATLSVAT